MSELFRSDINQLTYSLSQTAGKSSVIASNTAATLASMDELNANITNFSEQTQQGLTDVNATLDETYIQLNELLETANYIRETQFFQLNQITNLLESIDATLKAPNKTLANERFEIGVELLARNKTKHARRMFEEAVEFNPLHLGSYINLSVITYYEKDYEKAQTYAIEAFDLLPPNESSYKDLFAYVYCLLARAYAKNNHYDLAITYIEKAILECSNNKPVYCYERAKIHAWAGNTQGFLGSLYMAIKEDPQYFATALIDANFQPYKNEVEKLLTSAKEALERRIKESMHKLKNIRIPSYAFKSNHSTNRGYSNGKVNGIKPGTSVEYNYDKMKEHILGAVQEMKNIIQDAIQYGNNALNNDTFENYVKTYKMMNRYKNMVNDIINGIPQFVHRMNAHYSSLVASLQSSIRTYESQIVSHTETIKEIESKNTGILFKKKLSDDDKNNLVRAKEYIENCSKNMVATRQTITGVAEHAKEIKAFYDYFISTPKIPTLDVNFNLPMLFLHKDTNDIKIN